MAGGIGGMLGGISPSMAQGIGGPVLGVAQGVFNSTINNEAQRRNKAKLFELQQLEQRGQLGLNPQEERALDQSLNAPVARAAQDAQQRAERIAATAGSGASGGDLARLRTEASQLRAAGGQNAALEMAAANAAKELAQQNEIEQRIGLKAAMKRDDVDSIFNAASQVANAAGQTAGAPPSTQGIATTGASGTGAELPGATGGELPMEGAADSAGDAASAITDGAGSVARTQQPAGGPATFTPQEAKQFEDLANSDPKLFSQMFLASMAKKRNAGGTGG